MPLRPCRHLHTDGRQCGSPALTAEPFCFHHHTARKPMPERRNYDQTTAAQLPAPDDFLAIQRAIGEVLRLLINNRLTDRRAQVLLSGLAQASSNLARQHRHQARLDSQTTPAPDPITAYTNHPVHGTIALDPEETPATPDTPDTPAADTQQPTPLPDPIPRFTPDPEPYTSYDERQVLIIQARFQETFSKRHQEFTEEKTAQLEDLYQQRIDDRMAELDSRYRTRTAALEALYPQPTPTPTDPSETPSHHPQTPPIPEIPTQQNQDLTTSPTKKSPPSFPPLKQTA